MIKDHLNQKERYERLHPLFPKAFAFIEKAVKENYAAGKYELEGKELYAMVQEYDSKTDSKTEAHRKYIDIQFVVSGTECIEVFDMAQAVPLADFDEAVRVTKVQHAARVKVDEIGDPEKIGGVLGGMTTGADIVFRVAMKPTPSIFKSQRSVDLKTMRNVEFSIKGRHDPCVVFRAVPCVEAVAAIALYDLLSTESEGRL
jgi:YhcH/YjgK/YiaL family protein